MVFGAKYGLNVFSENAL